MGACDVTLRIPNRVHPVHQVFVDVVGRIHDHDDPVGMVDRRERDPWHRGVEGECLGVQKDDHHLRVLFALDRTRLWDELDAGPEGLDGLEWSRGRGRRDLRALNCCC